MAAEADSGLATLIGVDEDGAVPIVSEGGCDRGCGPGLSIVRIRLRELRPLVAGLGPDDLLIAIAAGARAQQELLPAGIAGAGYDGDLTSPSTRTDGVAISTDIAPTVLEHFGVDVPDEVERQRDRVRLRARPGRRSPTCRRALITAPVATRSSSCRWRSGWR